MYFVPMLAVAAAPAVTRMPRKRRRRRAGRADAGVVWDGSVEMTDDGTVTANGRPYAVPAGTTVDAFVRVRGLDPASVMSNATASRWSARGTQGRSWLMGTGWSWSGRWPVGELGDARRARLARSRLYVVTDARSERGDLATFLDAILGPASTSSSCARRTPKPVTCCGGRRCSARRPTVTARCSR